MPSIHRSSAVACGLVTTLFLSACAGWPPFRTQSASPPYTEQELHEDLAAYVARFTSVVAGVSEEIEDLSGSRRVRRSTLIWRLRMIPLAQELAFGDDPQESYVVSLGLAFTLRNYLTEGDGRELFGEHQPIAVEAARTVESFARDIGPRFLDEEQMAALVESLEELAREHPIRGRDFNVEAAQTAIAEIESGGAGLGWVTGIPMSPFRALEGVGTAGTAMLEINRTAARVRGDRRRAAPPEPLADRAIALRHRRAGYRDDGSRSLRAGGGKRRPRFPGYRALARRPARRPRRIPRGARRGQPHAADGPGADGARVRHGGGDRPDQHAAGEASAG